MSIIKLINKEIDSLKCSAEHDPYSGLRVDVDDDGVKVYDDHSSGIYDPNQLLEILTSTASASLDSESTENIWQIIAPAEF
jgi:hypothetical protein